MLLEKGTICQGCGKEEETATHFLAECEVRVGFRILDAIRLKKEELSFLKWADILDFIKRSRRLKWKG